MKKHSNNPYNMKNKELLLSARFKKSGKNADADFLKKKIDEMIAELYGM